MKETDGALKAGDKRGKKGELVISCSLLVCLRFHESPRGPSGAESLLPFVPLSHLHGHKDVLTGTRERPREEIVTFLVIIRPNNVSLPFDTIICRPLYVILEFILFSNKKNIMGQPPQN